MKHGKKPTVAQCKLIADQIYVDQKLNPHNWLVIKSLSDKIVIQHRETKLVIEIERR